MGLRRDESDEAYVIDLCDAILGETALRQHHFDWLLGDPGMKGTRRKLPVDAYYPEHKLIVEYHECQHDEPVAHFDKPHVLTVSGVHRGEQRRIYDERRTTEIPAHGLRLLVVRPHHLVCGSRGRLLRDHSADTKKLRFLLRRT
jgi:very-short-patch-repair endonuclease